MSISILVKQEKISDNRHRQILGVYSSPQMAWQTFHQRWLKKHYPYTDGTFRYNSIETFDLALNEASNGYLLIYQHEQFDIFIQWNILDQPLP